MSTNKTKQEMAIFIISEFCGTNRLGIGGSNNRKEEIEIAWGRREEDEEQDITMQTIDGIPLETEEKETQKKTCTLSELKDK